MLNKADEMAGFSFPEMALFIKLFNQGKPPGDHGQDVGGSFPYLVVVTTYPGASPEEVEQTVTVPVEQVAAYLPVKR